MFLMYVDESGDIGTVGSPTKYFILSAIVFHELKWTEILNDLIDFRRKLRNTKGLKLREEIHATHFVNRPGELRRIKRNDRIDILKQCIDWLKNQPDVNVITIVCNKQYKSKDEVFVKSWQALIQRFENTIRYRNFSGPLNENDKGIVIPDRTDERQLTQLVRRMRRYNPVPNIRKLYTNGFRDMPLNYVVEDPVMRESKNSFLHQMVDVVSYCARQIYEPNKYMRKKGGHRFYRRLDPVLVKQASSRHPLGIVEL